MTRNFLRFFFSSNTTDIPMHHCFYCLMILHHSRVRINLSDLNGGFDTDPCSFQHSLDPDWVWHWLAWYRLPPQSHDKPMSNNWQKDLHRWTEQLFSHFSVGVGYLELAAGQNSILNDKWRLTLGKFLPSIDFKTASHGSRQNSCT